MEKWSDPSYFIEKLLDTKKVSESYGLAETPPPLVEKFRKRAATFDRNASLSLQTWILLDMPPHDNEARNDQ